jgi:hypothetical protein
VRQQPDKRRHDRADIHLPLRFRDPLTHPSHPKNAQTKDLSLGGLCFRTEEFLPLDTTLLLELRLKNSARPLRSIARVAWTKTLPSGHRYEVGSEFVDIVLSERKALEDFLGIFPEGHS